MCSYINSHMHNREFRGKIVLLRQEDLVHASRFSSAGACALVATSKDPDAAGAEYKCSKETRIPVAFISDAGSQSLDHGSLVKLLFDVASSSPAPVTSKISKNAHYRRTLNGSKDATPPVGHTRSSRNLDHISELSADSGTDEDEDAEFCLVRRRHNRSATPSNVAHLHHSPARRSHPQPAPAYVAVSDVISDDESSISSRVDRRRNQDAKHCAHQAHAQDWAVSAHTNLGRANSIPARTVDSVIEELMNVKKSEVLRKVEQQSQALPAGVSADQLVAALASRIKQALTSFDPRQKWDAIFRLRELCRTKSDSCAPKVVEAIIHLPGAPDVFWQILGGSTLEKDAATTASWLSAQVLASTGFSTYTYDILVVMLALTPSY